MPRVTPFEEHHQRYEAWFDRHAVVYVSELLALRLFVPLQGRGIEIGVGSGRFAAPLGLRFGIDPSPAMLGYAAARGIATVGATAENLPFKTDSFDHALIMTTLCFVDSPTEMLNEACRVLKPGGRLVLGFLDRQSSLGQYYQTHQENIFYRDATFFSVGEVAELLRHTGFSIHGWVQTLEHPLPEIQEIEALRSGYGQCAFVVVAADALNK